MAMYSVKSESLTAVADAIRDRDGHNNKLVFPDDYISAVRKGNVPDDYKSFIEQAESMYNGDYANLAVLEWEEFVAIVFMMSDFAVTEYNETTTEFKAQGWVSCSFNKLNDNWSFTDWRDQPSTGGNYVMNIRYSSVYWEYGGQVIWPFGMSGGGSSGGVGGTCRTSDAASVFDASVVVFTSFTGHSEV